MWSDSSCKSGTFTFWIRVAAGIPLLDAFRSFLHHLHNEQIDCSDALYNVGQVPEGFAVAGGCRFERGEPSPVDDSSSQHTGSVTVSTHCPARPLTECLPADASAEGRARRGGQDPRRRVDERSGPLIVNKGEIRYDVLKFCRY